MNNGLHGGGISFKFTHRILFLVIILFLKILAFLKLTTDAKVFQLQLK